MIEIAGYSTVKGQVLDGDQLWTLIEGLEANDLLHYTHLLTGTLLFHLFIFLTTHNYTKFNIDCVCMKLLTYVG